MNKRQLQSNIELQGLYVARDMPHDFLLDVNTDRKKLLKETDVLEMDDTLAKQKFIDLSQLLSTLMVTKPWSLLIPHEAF